jgi:lysylphosphatidylglycerol synthetase-like protein (DUF2156 family)
VKPDLVRAYGSDPIAYSTLQPGLSYFETSFGYIAYAQAFGFAMTLGPPICAESNQAELIERFLRHHQRPIFFYVRKDIANLVMQLSGRRFHMSGMGIDKVLPLDMTSDKQHPRVRGALKKAQRGNLKVLEVRPSELRRVERERINAITRSYLQKSAVSVEMRFINRPLSFLDDGFARMFVLQQGPEASVFGYVVLDPYFDKGRVQGYLLNLIRFEPTRLWGVYYSAVTMLASKLKAEGIEQFSLGFCPLVDVNVDGCSPWLSRQMSWLEQKYANIEYFARLREIKEAFPGLSPQRYFVTPSPWAVTAVLALIKASGVPFTGIIRRAFSTT